MPLSIGYHRLPTDVAVANLAAERVTNGVYQVGDVMLDTAKRLADTALASEYPASIGVSEGQYYLASVHRPANSDVREHLSAIVAAFAQLPAPVVWPVHPRTAQNLANFGLDEAVAASGNIIAVTPTSYAETNALLRGARALLTDSGGMHKEAYFLGIPCVTLRDTTEWVETIELGWNRLVGADTDAIVAAASNLETPADRPPVYGDGRAAEAVVRCLEEFVAGR